MGLLERDMGYVIIGMRYRVWDYWNETWGMWLLEWDIGYGIIGMRHGVWVYWNEIWSVGVLKWDMEYRIIGMRQFYFDGFSLQTMNEYMCRVCVCVITNRSPYLLRLNGPTMIIICQEPVPRVHWPACSNTPSGNVNLEKRDIEIQWQWGYSVDSYVNNIGYIQWEGD